MCKTAFIRILAVSNGRLDCALKAQRVNSGTPHADQRGRHEPGNKTKAESIAAVKAHIESFPQYVSHYSRVDNPHRKYLSPELTIAKMYALYQEKCTDEGREAVSEWVYRKIFGEEYNLYFGR